VGWWRCRWRISLLTSQHWPSDGECTCHLAAAAAAAAAAQQTESATAARTEKCTHRIPEVTRCLAAGVESCQFVGCRPCLLLIPLQPLIAITVSTLHHHHHPSSVVTTLTA
jgi:hypothetical protein